MTSFIALLTVTLAVGVVHGGQEENAPAPVVHEYLLFDFRSSDKPGKVKDHFEAVTTIKALQGKRRKQKAYGYGRYFFLVQNDQSEELKELHLPRDASDVRVIPVEHLFAFFSHFSADAASWEAQNLVPQDNQDLTFVERVWHTDLNEGEFAAAVQGHALKVAPVQHKFRSQVFVQAAGLPTTFFFFMTVNDHTAAEILLKNADSMGGPGALDINTVKVFNLV